MLSWENEAAVAARLCAVAERPAPLALLPLSGGKNNRVFRLDMPDGASLILKSYFAHPADRRDRLATEWAFLNYAWSRGIRNVPQPLAHEPATQSGLYSFMPGDRLRRVNAAHIDAAAAFIRALNDFSHRVHELPLASEACFTLGQHIAAVERRIARLKAIDRDLPLGHEATFFVRTLLMPSWQDARARLEREARALGLGFDDGIAEADIIASPSDFGFHNALIHENGSIAFIDFEYAGQDDPAKLVCDFFCQPDVPVPKYAMPRFIDALGLDEHHRARCRLLLDAYRIKWICIILNDFLAAGAARRVFAGTGDNHARATAQLKQAAAKLDALYAPLSQG
jgi:hypothetical protein